MSLSSVEAQTGFVFRVDKIRWKIWVQTQGYLKSDGGIYGGRVAEVSIDPFDFAPALTSHSDIL